MTSILAAEAAALFSAYLSVVLVRDRFGLVTPARQALRNAIESRGWIVIDGGVGGMPALVRCDRCGADCPFNSEPASAIDHKNGLIILGEP